jgi:hypothetical protein
VFSWTGKKGAMAPDSAIDSTHCIKLVAGTQIDKTTGRVPNCRPTPGFPEQLAHSQQKAQQT